jgi:hypothetical protein
MTEGPGVGQWDCDSGAPCDDGTCVDNIVATIEANATLGSLVTSVHTTGQETAAFFPTPGAALWLSVATNSAANVVLVRGTDGSTHIPTPYLLLGSHQQGIKLGAGDYDGYLYVLDETGATARVYASAFYVGSSYFGSGGSTVNGNASFMSTDKATATDGYTVTVRSGNNTNTGDYTSGFVDVASGNTTTDGNTGPINIYSGVAGAGIADAGGIFMSVNGKTGTGTDVLTITGSAGAIDIAKLKAADLTAGSCTAGQVSWDTGGAAKELCLCTATNNWDCLTLTTANGPAD